MSALEKYFAAFRSKIIGIDQYFETPFGKKKIVYADWTASGRLYETIETKLKDDIGPFVANTHTETSLTGMMMTNAYHYALKYIKKHVNASEHDVIISSNSGMTGVVNKFQRILGLKVYEGHRDCLKLSEEETPVVFVTHMEHHSNQTSWIETIADLVIIPSDEKGMVDLEALKALLSKYKNRQTKIAAVTSYSNVTGVASPYYKIAEIMHDHQGLCFVDFACSAPYINIDMHPANKKQYLDAIYFSPHKFLGGPGSSGILIFNSTLYHNQIPDNPGGGTVEWTNPWGGHKYVDDIEQREDGGTPAFLQTMKVALAIKLKQEMGVENMLQREKEQLDLVWPILDHIPGLIVLAGNIRNRLSVISFFIRDLHYNLAVRLLNDRYGIQVRGGCSCAGTYGHMLLHVDPETSSEITCQINSGDLSSKPGWIRMSFHPTMTDDEILYILQAIEEVAKNHKDWGEDYVYSSKNNEFTHKDEKSLLKDQVVEWFEGKIG